MSTLYDWARSPRRFLVPSISSRKVKLWSYRDLVLLRFIAWMRRNHVSPKHVRLTLEAVESLTEGDFKALDRHPFMATDDPDIIVDLINNQSAIGGHLAAMLPEFNLVMVSEVPEIGRKKLWGPDLTRPSEHTLIDADVLAGEPFIEHRRVPTAAIQALVERGLHDDRIAQLYKLEPATVTEVRWLEASLKAGRKLERAA